MERERKKNNTIINVLLCLLYLKIKHKSYVGKKNPTQFFSKSTPAGKRWPAHYLIHLLKNKFEIRINSLSSSP